MGVAALLPAFMLVILVSGQGGGSTVDSFATALTTAWFRIQKNGTVAMTHSQLDPFTTGYVMDGWPSLQLIGDQELPIPPRTPGTLLSLVLDRGFINICDTEGDLLPWLKPPPTPNGWAVDWATGAIGDSMHDTVVELGRMYDIADLRINYTIITDAQAEAQNLSSSELCFKLLNESQVDMLHTFFGAGGLYGRQRRNIVFQRTVSWETDLGYMQVLESDIKSMTALQFAVTDTSKVCTAGQGSRQVLQSLFSQLPPENIIDLVESDALVEGLTSGTCVAIYAAPIVPNATVFPSNTLDPAVGYFRRDKPIDASAWQGNEQLALAYEAALSEAAFSGARRISLASIPSITFQSDCNLNPTVFQYPSPVEGGVLSRVLKDSSVTVGQLEGDAISEFPPWYGGSGGGAVHRLLSSIFATMSIYYNVLSDVHPVYKNYSDVNALFAALDNGEIDMTVPFMTGGVYYNGTFDYLHFRQGCSIAVMPYLWYRLRAQSGAANTSDDLLLIAAAAPPASITVAIHEQHTADILKATNPHVAAFNFILYPSLVAAINATLVGDVAYTLLPSNTVPGTTSLASFIAKIYRQCMPFFRKDVFEPRPLFDRLQFVDWSDGAAIVIILITSLFVLATIAAFATLAIYRGSPIVRLSPPLFLLVGFVGVMLGFAMIFTYIGHLKNASCALRPWLGGLAFSLIFSPMIAKQYRLARILTNTALVSTSIPVNVLLGISGVLVGIEILLLIIWTAVPSARLKSAVHVKSNRDAIILCTSSKKWIFIGLQMAYIAVVLVSGMILSFIIRKVVNRVLYKEMKWINYEFYTAVLWFLLFCAATGFLWENYLGYFILSTVTILLMTATVVCLLVVPKIYVLFGVKGGRESATMSTTGSEFSTDFKPDATEFS